MAVQLAKVRGAYVYGTAQAEKHDFLRSLGADEPIDYTQVDPAEVARDVDVVVDMIGGAGALRHVAALRPGGVLVGEGGAFDEGVRAAAADRDVRVQGILVEPDYAALERIAALVEAGKLRPEIAAVFPLEQASKAHAMGEQRRTAGKIVLQIA